MKTYSIGRDLNCDIVINDTTDVISRRHALLNVAPSGKMTLVDQSSNGTYVNGIRISPNVPVPVTRKDIISLAHVAKLDWRQVPGSNQWIKYAVWCLVAAVIILAIIFGIKAIKGGSSEKPEQPAPTAVQDSTLLKQKDAERLDSIKRAERQDSIRKKAEKGVQDTIKPKKPAASKKPAVPESKGKGKAKDKKENKGKEKSQNKKHTIG